MTYVVSVIKYKIMRGGADKYTELWMRNLKEREQSQMLEYNIEMDCREIQILRMGQLVLSVSHWSFVITVVNL